MGLNRYYIAGWSARFGTWMGEVIEAANMEAAKKRYITKYPTLKQITAYRLSGIQ